MARANLPDIDVTARYATIYLQAHGTTFSDLHKARAIVEPPIAGALALSHGAGGIANLRALIQAQEAAEDFNALTQAMARFHESLMEMHGNKTLTLIARIVHDLVRKYYVLLFTPTGRREEERLRNIRLGARAQNKLVDLIEAGNAQEAESF